MRCLPDTLPLRKRPISFASTLSADFSSSLSPILICSAMHSILLLACRTGRAAAAVLSGSARPISSVILGPHPSSRGCASSSSTCRPIAQEILCILVNSRAMTTRRVNTRTYHVFQRRYIRAALHRKSVARNPATSFEIGAAIAVRRAGKPYSGRNPGQATGDQRGEERRAPAPE